MRRIERELLDRGIAKIDIDGLPPEEVAVAVPSAALRELDTSLAEIAGPRRDSCIIARPPRAPLRRAPPRSR